MIAQVAITMNGVAFTRFIVSLVKILYRCVGDFISILAHVI